LEIGDLQARALQMGTVVVAALPVSASGPVHDVVGNELEIDLDQRMESGYWQDPPLFVQMADASILRRELRGLLRGRIPRSPALVGRALDLIGADYGVMVQVTSIRVFDEGVRVEERTAVVQRRVEESRVRERDTPRSVCGRPGRGREDGRGIRLDPAECRGWNSDGNSARASRRTFVTYEVGDTVTYRVFSGERVVQAEAEVLLVNLDGRAVAEFTVTSERRGSFREGEFTGDPWQLRLNRRDAPLFDWSVWDGEWIRIQRAVIDHLAGSIAAETFGEVLSRIH
jgi:hypothetical protein